VLNLSASYIDMNKKMEDFAKDILTDDEYEKAHELSWNVAKGSKQQRFEARVALMKMLEPPPRMLETAQSQIQYLPTSRYNSVQALRDYMDVLVKAISFEFTHNPGCKEDSLTENIARLDSEGHYQELVDNLKAYDDLFYDSQGSRLLGTPREEHHFTSRETVYMVFFTLKLAKRLTKVSEIAKKISLDKETIEEM
jgi:hypothetical protein